MIKTVSVDGSREVIWNEFRREKLPDHFGGYFSYEKDTALCKLSEASFRELISNELQKKKPCIDSKNALQHIITELNSKHNFTNRFKERHQEFGISSILGCQLWKFLVEDENM